MKDKQFSKYYLFTCVGVLLASCYPLWMGVRVVTDMIANGAVSKENYPKYVIPYTPICLAVLIGVFIMPFCMKLLKQYALAGGSVLAIGAFFALEILFERKIVVTTARLEDWQMFMCVATYKQELTAVDILMGNYNPAFKLHFYIISAVLILSILNSLYGFGQMIKNRDKKRLKALVLQSVCSFLFLGLCILACFTAFWRDGNIRVSPLSAALMGIFFIILGVTTGVYVGSFLMGKRKFVSVWIPAFAAAAMTLLMYVGEMILLHGHLYRFGTGFIFDSIANIVFALIDLLIIMVSGFATALIFTFLDRTKG